MAKAARKSRKTAKKSSKSAKGARRPPAKKRSTTTKRATASKRSTGKKRWSRRVTERSDALDLENKVFAQKSPKKIATSLKRSAERSKRRKAEPFRSAMSMLTFYINRAGKNLPASRKKVLNQAKDELRAQFGRT